MSGRIDCIGGYLVFRTSGTQSKRTSLKLKMDKKTFDKYFNKDKQRFNKTHNGQTLNGYDYYNQVIEKAFKDYSKNNDNIEILRESKKSFLQYWSTIIETTTNHGTRIKNQNVKAKLEKYVNSLNKRDLLFSDITTPFIKSIRHHFLTVADPKKLSNNTCNHYLKIIQGVINQAEKDLYYNYLINPFKPIEFNKVTQHRAMMSQTEVSKLLNTKIPKTDKKNNRIDLCRDMILFQVFANGMRVSDLFTLRWSNLKFDSSGDNHRLIYTMFKTGAAVNIPLNRNLLMILFKIIGHTEDAESVISSTNVMGYYNRSASKYLKNKLVKKIKEEDKYLKKLDTEILIDTDSLLANRLLELITDMDRQLFIFPILDNEQFEYIGVNNDFSMIEEKEYKTIKHCTIVYDRGLKDLAKFCEMEINLSSHVSRHTFTNLVLMLKDINMYDLQQMLRHSSLSITQEYLKEGFNISKQDHANRQLSDFIPKQ